MGINTHTDQPAIATIKGLGVIRINSRSRSVSVEKPKENPKNTADNGTERYRANIITPLD